MNIKNLVIVPVWFIMISFPNWISAQEKSVLIDEYPIPSYILPDPLVLSDGSRIVDKQFWWDRRRPEILQLFETEEYGKIPSDSIATSFEVISRDENAIGGKASRKEIRISFVKNNRKLSMILLVILPKSVSPAPVFLGLNFNGNQTISNDTGISISEGWGASRNARGTDSLGWPLERIIDRGFGVATVYYGDIEPDLNNGFKSGIHPLFYQPGQARPGPDEWGSIAAWAWGLSRAMDYLVTDKMVDSKKVIVFGHSRLGKAALWAGAGDQRFAAVISNNSGCGGAALSKRIFGETVSAINTGFPHWFCDNFKKYNDKEPLLPFDQHMLIALIAPRPVYIASAEEDGWADPKGEFLSGFYASGVYKFLGTDGLAATEMPPLNSPVMSTIGYHIRPGKHAITPADWEFFLNFIELHLSEKH